VLTVTKKIRRMQAQEEAGMSTGRQGGDTMMIIIHTLRGSLSSQHSGLVGKRVGSGTLLFGSSVWGGFG